MWIEKHREIFYPNSSLFFSVCGWLFCLGGNLWVSYRNAKVGAEAVISYGAEFNGFFIRYFFAFGGATIAAIGFSLAIIAYLLKIRGRKVIISLVLSGILTIPLTVILLIAAIKAQGH